jgi:predicted membrane-bound dolichyl-phosphate-mannose-protein mannosyltransferase
MNFATNCTTSAVAIISTLLFASQVFFFVQSSMLLPEVMVTLFIFTSIYFFNAEKYIALAGSLSLLFLTKESGLVLGIILGIAFIIPYLIRAIHVSKK